MTEIKINTATISDIPAMVSLSYQKRKECEAVQPQFWRYAENAEAVQAKWFEELLKDDSYIMLVATMRHGESEAHGHSVNYHKIAGSPRFARDDEWMHNNQELFQAFIIGRLIKAPEVYDPGGLTLMIDDFCVASPELWETIGTALVSKIKEIANEKGATQILVVSGDHDIAKNSFLKKSGLVVASRWYVGGIK